MALLGGTLRLTLLKLPKSAVINLVQRYASEKSPKNSSDYPPVTTETKITKKTRGDTSYAGHDALPHP